MVTTVELTVTGMHCASCAALIEEVLAEQPGLVAARVDLETERAEVSFDDTVTDLGAVQSAIAELGYGSSQSRGSRLPTCAVTAVLPSADHRSGDVNGLATSELAIGGMHCASCAQRVQRSLRDVPAVASAAVNLATERAYVTFDPAGTSTDDLCRRGRRRRILGRTGAPERRGHRRAGRPRRLAVAGHRVVAAGPRRALRRPVRARDRNQRLDRPPPRRSPCRSSAAGRSCARVPACSVTARRAWTR